MDSVKRVLLVEDDAHVAKLLRVHLRDEGYVVVHAADGRAGQREVERGNQDALVLDLMLPGIDGLEIYRHARVQARYIPIIIISARSTEVYRILGLELGADDYLAKPFSVLGLVMRVKVLVRHTDVLACNVRIESGSLALGNLEIESLAREVRADGKSIELMPHEFDLLHFFARHPGKMFSRLSPLNQVRGYQHDGYKHMANIRINRLRAKVKVDPAQPRRILTVWGRGYKPSIRADNEESAV